MKVEHRFRRVGCRKWLTVPELAIKYGSRDVADRIKDAKESDPELSKTQVRYHKDAPGVEATCQHISNMHA